MRFWMILVIFFIILTFGVTAYKWWHTPAYIKPLSPALKMIGVVDLDNNHGVDFNTVRKGKDIVLVLLNTEYRNEYIPTHPKANFFYTKPFDLVNFDTGKGILNKDSDLWPYLAVLVYVENGANYELLRPEDVGIIGIKTQHISEGGDHTVFFENGQTRILYEVSKFT